MSNVFLSSSLLYLASVEAGCVVFEKEDNSNNNTAEEEEGSLIDNCLNETHGFKPTSLISNVSVISGLLGAFLSPVLGASIDILHHNMCPRQSRDYNRHIDNNNSMCSN